MEALSIEGTAKTPSVKFNGQEGVIEIKGRSIPENSIEFYKPLVEWLEDYSSTPLDLTQVNVQLEYFNTSSSKVILNILKKFETIPDAKEKVVVNWYYEANDEDDLETGEYFSQMTILSFNFIGI